jgi:hypothetical protein
LRIECDLKTGAFDCRWATGQTQLLGAACAAKLDGQASELCSAHQARHEIADGDIEPFADSTGKGLRLTIHHRQDAQPELRQQLWVYDDQPWFLTSVEVIADADKTLASNHISPIVLASDQATLDLGVAPGHPRVLFVPYDNDVWVRYNDPENPKDDPDSYEVTAIYDNASRHGVVIGSVSHDLWKTGIEARRIEGSRINQLEIFGGATGKLTRDSQPHGIVRGKTIASPRIFVGRFDDWRDGLESFGQFNARLSPPPAWEGGVPFGWNSWAAFGTKIDYRHFAAVSDFLKKEIQPRGFSNGDGTLYVNWDSFWDKSSEQQLRDAVKHCHDNGQKAGIYFAPFGSWGGDGKLDDIVEGTDGKYRIRDLLLKGASGQPLPLLDDGHPLDPTHPGTLARIDWQLQRFIDWGYDFVKLDFLNFAALEGVHFDPAMTTGTAAYNLAMPRIVSGLSLEKAGRPIFISLSIAPLFPAYGHSRRVSCDVFGQLQDSEYLLNAVTYGWWIHGTLYHFNDPDHIVLAARDKPANYNEARTRVNASVIAGTVMIDSDDLTKSHPQKRAKGLLTNEKINAIARAGKTFRPVEDAAKDGASAAFVRLDQASGACRVAVFKYDTQTTA